MIDAILKKLKKNNGESLAETLVAAVIAAAAMVILAGALVTSSRTGKAAKDLGSFASDTEIEQGESVVFKVGSDSKSYDVDVYSKEEKDDEEIRKVYYYEIAK